MKAAATLDTALAKRALEGAGADVDEGLLREVQDLFNRADYRAAAVRAAVALRDGATDIRVLAPYLLGAFLEKGPEALPAVLGILSSALSDRWTAVRPAARKVRVADSALSSLFRAIAIQIDFHAKIDDATSRAWARADAAVGRPSLEASSALRKAIEAVIDKARSTAQLSEVDVRIRTQWSRVEATPPVLTAAPEPATRDARDGEGEEDVEAPEPEEPPPSPPEAHPQAPPELRGAAARSLEVSPAMQVFLRKLEAFEALVSRGDMERAAIVAEDVRSILEAFDPRVYFPGLLSSYARVLATHVNEIAPHWESLGSPPWRALEQLYRVDLDAFLAE